MFRSTVKKIFFFCAFLCLMAAVAAAQPVKNRRDSQGRKQGYWEVTDRNGRLVYSGSFKDDKPAGEMKRYHPQGGVRVVMNYREGSDRISSRFFWQNGEIAAEGNYIGNKRDSLWIFYSYYTRKKSCQMYYVNGMRNGKSQSFYPNGSVNEEINWINDMKEGQWQQFFESGKLKLTATYKNNQLEGSYTIFYPDGKKETAGQYRNHQPEGQWFHYHLDGTVAAAIEYKDGIIVNREQLTAAEQEFFRKIEAEKGRIKEPDIEDFLREARE
ncbi:MAG: hypothetical protein LBF89_02220 [Bacteroidales bacterium]|jgi:antitoxin component YwqK of YwqJK toxin-antitoxin module|nr:hypothetical protein [Bacteroidales bacterium]